MDEQPDISESESKGGSAVFKLSRLCTIPSDGKTHKQTIGTVKLAPSFTYVISPKVTPDCYLRCTSKNESPFVFVPGPMSVFFNNSLVTTTKMGLVRVNESFSMSLGIEDTVKIDYQPEIIKRDQKSAFFSAAKSSETISRTIRIINTRTEAISCVLYEQLPLAKDEEIKVDLVEPDLKFKKGNHWYKLNKFNLLEARNKVKAGSEWIVKFTYKIEWPKNRDLYYHESLENMRT